MNRFSTPKSLAGLALGAIASLLFVATPPTAHAQSFADQSIFTEHEPFEVGKTRLEPGTYLIRVVLQANNRTVVQVTDTEQKTIYASVLSSPHPVLAEPTIQANQYVFYPPTPGHAKALRTWFAKGANMGQDIVYTRGRAAEIAIAVKEPVPAVADDVREEDYKTAEIIVVTPESVQSRPPAPRPILVAEARTDDSLPPTAGRDPLLAALGLVSLAGALALRFARKA